MGECDVTCDKEREQVGDGLPKWVVARADGPVVAKLSGIPALEGLSPLAKPKVRPGEPIRFAVDVLAEPTGLLSKHAYIAGLGPGWSNFELTCDEGRPLGGTDLAPSPLSYLVSGVAFCLLTHIQQYLRVHPLDIDRIRLELRANYRMAQPGASRSEHEVAACEGMEACVLIDGDVSEAFVEAMMDEVNKACMALQTVIQRVPASTRVILNGNTCA